MAIVRYNTVPGRHLQDEFRQVFERFLGEAGADPSDVVTSQWAPSVDIREEADRFVIFADIPGVDPKEIEVQMDKGVLTLKGERAGEEGETQGYSRRERAWGAFHRRFALPDSADADNITASGRNGVLRIDIPKRPRATPRRIEVQ
ncbi:Hsp20/alpha crystallin family protein [Pseudoxanthomonas daejeonensis]|uniref:Hsp20/alpha crystallin family protein n=1 Tax=Pseudoxanthomonas daejeonensis TaxID=266062 RepID=UPI001F54586B|nr:Hsp20/alpha crystallin family protein [Pseudoxanthomonas daejeonensis]UNK57047.1 Hsp20/alpha crystallin family protein [Pseudoxanthomonas daejeonensis]